MGRLRVGTIAGMSVAASALTFTFTHCASPTEIVLDVRTDANMCGRIEAAIAVGPADDNDAPFDAFQSGCQKGTAKVGTLSITPSGDNDETIGIRIVGAIDGKRPEDCVQSDAKCIVVRRRERFTPGQSVKLQVNLSASCLGIECAAGYSCEEGKCVDVGKISQDGGILPAVDGEAPVDARLPPADVVEPPPDVIIPGEDACVASCKGGNTECDGVKRTCKVTCNGANCARTTVCSGDFDCEVVCKNQGSCNDTRCEGKSCKIDCTGGNDRCDNVACAATGACNVTCGGNGACEGVFLDAGTNVVACNSPNENVSCNNVQCIGNGADQACVRTCTPFSACGPLYSCDGGCANFADGGDGGDGAPP